MELKDKAIKIKGKDYVLVSDRILAFNEEYDKADIKTSYEYLEQLNMFVVRAEITTERGTFTGMSQAVVGDGYINKTSALENAETSAVGRALGMMGIGVLDSVASADEVNKASNNEIKTNTISKMENGLNKAKIAKWLNNISLEESKKQLETPEDYKEMCLKQTKLELIPENYEEIIKFIK